MTDDELLAAFECCELPLESWTHEAHVRVAWMYCSRHELPEAVHRVRVSIQAYNKATNTPDKIDRGYHETMTQAFMKLVDTANRKTGPHVSSIEFCSDHPELMTKQILNRYYSRERIMTWEAKREFVEPDLLPFTE